MHSSRSRCGDTLTVARISGRTAPKISAQNLHGETFGVLHEEHKRHTSCPHCMSQRRDRFVMPSWTSTPALTEPKQFACTVFPVLVLIFFSSKRRWPQSYQTKYFHLLRVGRSMAKTEVMHRNLPDGWSTRFFHLTTHFCTKFDIYFANVLGFYTKIAFPLIQPEQKSFLFQKKNDSVETKQIDLLRCLCIAAPLSLCVSSGKSAVEKYDSRCYRSSSWRTDGTLGSFILTLHNSVPHPVKVVGFILFLSRTEARVC